MNQITVKTQQELDAIPVDFGGIIYIEFGTPSIPALVTKKYNYATVILRRHSYAELWGSSSAELWGSSSAVLRESSRAVLRGSSSAVLREASRAELREFSSAELRESSSAELREFSSAVLWGSSSAELWGASRAAANGFAQIVKMSNHAQTEIRDMARCVEPTADMDTFCLYHSIKCEGEESVWYKAVHRSGGCYTSDHDKSFTYTVGAESSVEDLNTDRERNCGTGIHIATLPLALEHGEDWPDFAILEVRAKTSEIVLPYASDGKVRTRSVKVVREVLLEECGTYGKMLAERRKKHET